MGPAEAVHDLGHTQGTAIGDLGHAMDDAAVHDDAGAGVHGLGHSGDAATCDLGNANDAEDDETDV